MNKKTLCTNLLPFLYDYSKILTLICINNTLTQKLLTFDTKVLLKKTRYL